MPVGVYIAVPFCRSKCTFCNFASGVFSRHKMSGYVAGLRQEIACAESLAIGIGAEFDRRVDSIYLGGGTPTTLEVDQLAEVFRIVHGQLDVDKQAEVTIECAPGTLHPEILETLLVAGVNRVSLGAQSFVDQEIRAVGRLHTAEQARADVANLQKNGIGNINLDLIAGLPHQTSQSWQVSLQQLAELNVPHASVYILEIDDESRLGRELIAGGERYHAHHVPDSDLSAEMYLQALDFLAKAGLAQYEISNLCRPGRESRHNIKYWTRQPYLGFGLDAHSMLPARDHAQCESIRFSNTENLETYMASPTPSSFERIDRQQATEESMFLPLRLNRGVDLNLVGFGAREMFEGEIRELIELGLLQQHENWLRLTDRGRLLSNEVFEKFISEKQIA
jgi:oxygen-independent coproporphyrinogen-3 oxidase